MKNKRAKSIIAAIAAAAMITTTTVPALANDTKEVTTGFGVTCTVDYTQGAANIAGKRVYFGMKLSDPDVKSCGWRRALELRAMGVADLSEIDPAWFAWFTRNCPTVEEWLRWHSAK